MKKSLLFYSLLLTGCLMSNSIIAQCANAEVTTLAGMAGISGDTNGNGTAASFFRPTGVAADANGNVYVADQFNHLIRKITPVGDVTTLAGMTGTPGYANGTGTAAIFNYPADVVTDAAGNVYVADFGNHRIRKITPAGVVTTFAGSGAVGADNGTVTAASFNQPAGLATDAAGNMYVAEHGNHLIRKITPAGDVTTLAGMAGTPGDTNGNGTAASFNYPTGVAADANGNVYVAEHGNHLIRKITPVGDVTTLAGMSGTPGYANGTGTAASFNTPYGVVTDPAGNVYVADQFNHRIRKITPAGMVTTFVGSGAVGADNGTITLASFNQPAGLTTDAAGNMYVADFNNHLIRKICFPDSPFPVELLLFTGKIVDYQIFLNWYTASELNNSGFHLQRSLDGKTWYNLAFITGHGTSYEEQAYNYIDKRPLSGLNYYRLKQVDYDEAFEYSKVISVEVTAEGSGIRLFPNPTTHSVTLALESDYTGEATLTLYDLTGKKMKTEVLSLEGDTFRSEIGLDGLHAGVYLAEIIAGREQWWKRLIIE